MASFSSLGKMGMGTGKKQDLSQVTMQKEGNTGWETKDLEMTEKVCIQQVLQL